MSSIRAPRVSVLMTVYNGARHLRAAVDSIVGQTFHDWELIVIDDGSADESPRILAGYGDPRVRATCLPRNIGRTPALRQAFAMARGELVAVLDADDVAHRERLAKQVAYFDAHPDTVLLGTWARFVDERGDTLRHWRPPTDARALHHSLGWANPIAHSTSMYRARIAADVGGYPADLPYAQDYGLWLRLAQRGNLAILAEELCDQRIVATSMTRGPRFRTAVARDGMTLLRDARSRLVLDDLARLRNRDEIMIAEVKYGLALARSGPMLAGYATILMAILRNPLGLLHSRAHRTQFYG
jgi:hypothetical protein